jgi:hypothetical protein
MKKSVVLMLSAVLLTLTLLSCGEQPEGTIRILSVTPSSGLVDGNSYDFVVEVEYELYSTPEGELNVGFNTAGVDVYAIVVSETVIVGEGAGQHTFSTTNIQAIDWGASGDFKAYVNISEYPHESVWTPLDSDRMVLTF